MPGPHTVIEQVGVVVPFIVRGRLRKQENYLFGQVVEEVLLRIRYMQELLLCEIRKELYDYGYYLYTR
jgi:hypothetical protein